MEVREIRIRQGMSQGELAKKAGLDPSQLSRLERGNRKPQIETLQKIAEALDVPVDTILGGADLGGVRPLLIPCEHCGIEIITDPRTVPVGADLVYSHVTKPGMDPTIAPGDVVLIDKSDKDLTTGGIFSLETTQGGVCVRVEFCEIKQMPILSYDNPDLKDPGYTPTSDLEVHGKVVKIMKTEGFQNHRA